jgi:hypothetical protein
MFNQRVYTTIDHDSKKGSPENIKHTWDPKLKKTAFHRFPPFSRVQNGWCSA